MSAMKIKKGDTVKVIAGKDKDKEGKVLAVNAKSNTVIVEGINMITKHSKPSVANQNGGIVHQESPIDASNVMLVFKGIVEVLFAMVVVDRVITEVRNAFSKSK